MSLAKPIVTNYFSGAQSFGDAEVLRDWTESLARQQAILSDSGARDGLEFQIFQEIEDRLTRRCAELEAELRRSSPATQDREMARKVSNLENSLRASQEECAVLRKICEADTVLNALNDEAENVAIARQARLDEQAERLRRYSEAIKQEKDWIRATATTMENEIRSMIALHPLRDYLQLTERETNRVEIELKRMPTSAPQRASLEDCFTQLISQREFLRTVLDASLKESEVRADMLAKIHSDAQAAPLVPCPVPRRSSSGV